MKDNKTKLNKTLDNLLHVSGELVAVLESSNRLTRLSLHNWCNKLEQSLEHLRSVAKPEERHDVDE